MKKNNSINIILILILLVGLSLLLYPSISDYWNSLHQSRAITSYAEQVSNMNEEEYARIFQEAEEFNAEILTRSNTFVLTDDQKERYYELLNVSGIGVMGYVEIPSIDCSLPIYHGTSDSVLQVAVGHLDWTSLPVGGENTHCVLSGHRGLPSARLFTDLDELKPGDIFTLNILNEVLTYEVDQIRTVEPTETRDLLIEKGKDYCTLVTCTPYGINSHRMLVRGQRIETIEKKNIRIVSEAMRIEPLLVAPLVAIPILVFLLIALIIADFKKKTGGKS